MNPIYVYGNGEILSTTLHAISILLYGHEDHLLDTTFQLAVSIISLWMALYIAFLRRWGYVLNWVVLIMAMNVILLVPTTRVTIIDVLNHRKPISVDNVPVVLASIASITTTLGHGLTEAIETHFSTPDSYQFHKTGSLFGSRLTQDMGQVHIEDAHFSRTMKSFINQCVIQSSMAGITYNVREVKESSNLWALIRADAPQSVSFTFYDPDGSRTVTCREGTELIEDLWTPEIDKIAGRILPASVSLGEGMGDMTLSRYVKSQFRTLGAELGDATLQGEDLVRQEIMMNEIRSVNQSLLSEYGAGAEYAIAKAEKEQHVSGLTAGEIWSKTGLQLRNVLQIMMIASFLFLVPFLLFPRGWKFLIHYCQIMLSIELWAPLNAILNMIMYYHMNGQATSILGVEGLSLLTTNKYHNLHIGSIAWASWIQGFIPFISYGLIKAGTFALDGLSHSFTNASHGAALGAAREMVSGNYQAGNVSVGNKSINSNSGFQHTLSPTYQDGQFSSVMNDGGQRTVNPDGSVVYRGGSGTVVSDFANSYSLSESFGQVANEQYNQSLSMTATRSKEVTDAQSQVNRRFADYSHRIADGHSTGQDFLKDMSYGDQQFLSKMKDIAHTVQRQHGLSQDQSAVIAAGVAGGVSTPTILKWGLGFELGGKASVDASTRGSATNAINTAQDMAQRLQINQNLDHVLRNAQSSRQGEHQSEDKSYQTGFAGSLEDLHSARHNHQAALQRQEGLSKTVQDFNNRTFTENQNFNQKLLEYTAQQPGPSGEPMGHDQAYPLLQEGGSQLKPYVEGFVQEYAHMREPTHSYESSQQRMKDRYEVSSAQINQSYDHSDQYLQDVKTSAQRQGFPVKGPETNLELIATYQEKEQQWKEKQESAQRDMEQFEEQTRKDAQKVKKSNWLSVGKTATKGIINSGIRTHQPKGGEKSLEEILGQDFKVDSSQDKKYNQRIRQEHNSDKNNNR